MENKIQSIQKEVAEQLNKLTTPQELTNYKKEILGKKGPISALSAEMRNLEPEQKKEFGAQLQKLRKEVESSLQDRMQLLERESLNKKLEGSWTDPSRRGSVYDQGLSEAGLHPITEIMYELEEIFSRMGFEVLDGPHIEDDFHNFTALNIPEAHPARDLQDTFWFEGGEQLLRTHTSCMQIRGMKEREAPVKFIGPGQAFRCERTDQWHDFSFFQLEGLYIDENISVANLLYFAQTLFEEIFKKKVEIRTRPSYFPFVEPGLEIDMRHENGKWIEMLGSGMVHPKVLQHLGVDSKRHSGFAFGLGVDRLLLMRHGVEDIRHLRSGDLRFVKQFSQYRSGALRPLKELAQTLRQKGAL